MSRGALAGTTALAAALLGSATAVAPGAAAAACGSSGVTVVVDAGTRAGMSTRCAPGDPGSGLAALRGSGHTLTFVPRQPGFVCTIDAVPAGCNGAPPDAYWSYWTAKRGGSWSYSTAGAGSRDPAPGSVEGWAFGAGRPPRTRPPAAAAVPTPRPAPTSRPVVPTARPVPSATRPTPSATRSARPSPSPTTRSVPPTGATSRGSAAAPVSTSTVTPQPTATTQGASGTSATSSTVSGPAAAAPVTTQPPAVAAAGTPSPAPATTFSTPAPAGPTTADAQGGMRLWSATVLVGVLGLAAGLTSYGRRRGRR